MTILNENDSLVLIIDIQERLLNATFNKDLLIKNAKIIAKAASVLNIPIIITEQYPQGLGYTTPELKECISDNSKIFEKTSFSVLDNIDIANSIDKFNRKQIIILGIETHICVSQTAHALILNGYDVTLIQDASGSRSEFQHNAGIDRIRTNGGNIITTEIALFEWLKSSKHEKFKEIQQLIK